MSSASASGRPPQLKSSSVIQLLQKYYDVTEIVESSLRQFPSYYDSNFYFRGTLRENGGVQVQGEYMFKIMNSIRTSKEMATALSALWCHLQEKGLKYTGPLHNRQGEMVTVLTSQELLHSVKDEQLGEDRVFCARMMRFIPGHTLDSIDKCDLTPMLLFEVGAFIAKVDTALQDGFCNSAIENRANLDWDLIHFPVIRKYLSSLDDPRKQQMVESALSGFEEHVLHCVPTFKKGIIYNDASGQNIIVQRDENTDRYKVVGMIDFDETVFSCYIFDLAVALAYLLMENLSPIAIGCSSPIDFMAPLVAGYASVFPLTTEECDCLYYLTLARCCQSAVSGEVSFKAEPWNEYLLTTPKKSWRVIELLLSTGHERVSEVWKNSIGKCATDFK